MPKLFAALGLAVLALGLPAFKPALSLPLDEEEKADPKEKRRPPTAAGEIIRLVLDKARRKVRIHTGPNYTVFSDDLELDMKALGGHLERTLPRLEEILGARIPESASSLPVIHFKDEADYRLFCKGVGLEAYAVEGYGCYAPGLHFQPIIVQGLMLGTLRHEGTHQFVDRAMGKGLRGIAWVSEGLGALFESYPPEDFTRFRRYREGRRRILEADFSMEPFVKEKGRSPGMYGVGATIHGVFLFGKDRIGYGKWLRDLARGKCRLEDLPRYLEKTWARLAEQVQQFCRKNPPP